MKRRRSGDTSILPTAFKPSEQMDCVIVECRPADGRRKGGEANEIRPKRGLLNPMDFGKDASLAASHSQGKKAIIRICCFRQARALVKALWQVAKEKGLRCLSKQQMFWLVAKAR